MCSSAAATKPVALFVSDIQRATQATLAVHQLATTLGPHAGAETNGTLALDAAGAAGVVNSHQIVSRRVERIAPLPGRVHACPQVPATAGADTDSPLPAAQDVWLLIGFGEQKSVGLSLAGQIRHGREVALFGSSFLGHKWQCDRVFTHNRAPACSGGVADHFRA